MATTTIDAADERERAVTTAKEKVRAARLRYEAAHLDLTAAQLRRNPGAKVERPAGAAPQRS